MNPSRARVTLSLNSQGEGLTDPMVSVGQFLSPLAKVSLSGFEPTDQTVFGCL